MVGLEAGGGAFALRLFVDALRELAHVGWAEQLIAPLHTVPWDEADKRAIPLVLLPLVHRADGSDDAYVQPVGQR